MNKPYKKGEKVERTKIDKERTWIFSPVNNIVIKVDIKGYILDELRIY